MTDEQPDTTAAAQLLVDAFGRIRQLVAKATDGASTEALAHHPTPSANSIGWLVWHLTRVQDTHVTELADLPTIWETEGWVDRFDLSLPRDATGYGATPDEVAALDGVTADLLDGYHRAVHEMTLSYLRGLDDRALDEVVDRSWDPPVTAGARLVSVISDCLQHLGQAAYVRGLQEDSDATSA